MPSMVAFLYEYDAAEKACDVLGENGIEATMVDTRMGRYLQLLFAGNSNGYRIMVSDKDLEKADSILAAHATEIMAAGAEKTPPPTRAEKMQNFLWLLLLVILILMMIIGFLRNSH